MLINNNYGAPSSCLTSWRIAWRPVVTSGYLLLFTRHRGDA